MMNVDRNSSSRRYRPPQKLSNILADVITQRGYARQIGTSRYQDAWQASVDPELARSSRPGRMRNRVLEITVETSMIMQELAFQKKTIINRLNRQLNLKLTDLRFRLGTID